MLVLAGCAARQSTAPASAPAPASSTPGSTTVKSPDGSTTGEMIGTPSPGSKFSRVRIGMALRQVQDLIGQPNDVASHITGKAFIPFYFGGDTTMTELFYKNEGQLSFAAPTIGSTAVQLIRIVVNPSEQGYAH